MTQSNRQARILRRFTKTIRGRRLTTYRRQNLSKVIQQTLAGAYAEGEDRQYQASFSDEGVRKSKYIIDHLKGEELLTTVRTDELGYLSIGGSDGSEIEAVMRATGIRKGVLLEYDQTAAEAAGKRAVELLKSGKELAIVIGDATTHIDKCLKILAGWRETSGLHGLVCSAQGVLHELPMRSPGFKMTTFIGKLFRGGWQACYFYSREPGEVEGWPTEVHIRIPELKATELIRYARYVSDRLGFNETPPEELAGDWVVMSANLAIETLHKLIRDDSLARRGYEFGERLTSFNPLALAAFLEKSVTGMQVNVERVATTGFKEALKAYGVQYRTVNLEPLAIPRTHAEIIGVHCALPPRTPQESSLIARGADSARTPQADLEDLNVEEIFQGEITRNEVAFWLSQFDISDRSAIILALKSFNYIGQLRTAQLCTELHQSILDAAKGAPIKYVPFGGPGRSGGLIAYEFRKANGLDATDLIEQSAIGGVAPETVIVLLDDIVATGHQAVQELKRVQRVEESKRVILAVLAATSEGAAYVEEHIGVEVLSSLDLSMKTNPLLVGVDAKTTRDVFERYGARILPNSPLGYNSGAHLIGFHHAAPDNSPPVFWASAADWVPLLRRGGSNRTSPIAKI